MNTKQLVFVIVAFLFMFAASVSSFTLGNIDGGIAWLCAIVWFVLFVGVWNCYIDDRIETVKKDKRITELVECNNHLTKSWYDSQDSTSKLLKELVLNLHEDMKSHHDCIVKDITDVIENNE